MNSLRVEADGAMRAGAQDLAPFCVCVPARDEEDQLPRLLGALADQDIDGTINVAICLNNTKDHSARVIDAARMRHADRLSITLDIRSFPPDLAHAGSARAVAMEIGLAILGEANGVLIATDADTRPPSNWIGENLNTIAAGADIVGGRLVLDEDEPIDPAIAQGRALWDRYWVAVRAIEDAIDPNPRDPPPRHGDHTGASLALTCEIYRRSGGVPIIAAGEDRALVEAAIGVGGHLVHPPSVWTRVSPRQHGRAANGMADMMMSMRDRLEAGEALMAPALAHWRARAQWRNEMRAAGHGIGRVIEAERALPPMPHDALLSEMGSGR